MDSTRRSPQGFFGKHAQGYATSDSHAHGSDLQVLIQTLKPARTDVVLDVATGTGFTAVSLARLVKDVIAIDVTDQMLAEARRLASEQGAKNVKFVRGDAHKLRYPDSSFDIVTTRRAAHHFDDVPKFLLQVKRVLRPNGRLGLVDMSAPEGAETFLNELERLRDPSHVRAFTSNQWLTMLERAGLEVVSEQILEEHLQFERWLYPIKEGGREDKAVRLAWKSAPSQVNDLLKVEVQNGIAKGWSKSRIVLVAKNH